MLVLILFTSGWNKMRPMEAFTMDAFAEQCLVQLDLEYFEKLPNTVTVIITAQPEA